MMQQYTNKNLNCVDCGQTFLFSADDQEFYARKGFTNEPKRCKICRDKRKTDIRTKQGQSTLQDAVT